MGGNDYKYKLDKTRTFFHIFVSFRCHFERAGLDLFDLTWGFAQRLPDGHAGKLGPRRTNCF